MRKFVIGERFEKIDLSFSEVANGNGKVPIDVLIKKLKDLKDQGASYILSKEVQEGDYGSLTAVNYRMEDDEEYKLRIQGLINRKNKSKVKL